MVLYWYIHFTMKNLHLPEYSAEEFRCHEHQYQHLAFPVELARMGVCFPFHSGWNSRNIGTADMCVCVKDSVSFVM